MAAYSFSCGEVASFSSFATVNFKVIINFVPNPGLLSTSIVPPIKEIKFFEIARPSPVPP